MQDGLNLSELDWFVEYLIHACLETLVFESVLNMACDAYNGRLLRFLDTSLFKLLPDQFSCLDSIHDRHTKVSQDQFVPKARRVGFGDTLDSLVTRDTEVNLVFSVDSCHLENDLHR